MLTILVKLIQFTNSKGFNDCNCKIAWLTAWFVGIILTSLVNLFVSVILYQEFLISPKLSN